MLRAHLQQPSRDRYRRQDIYDIAYLRDENEMSSADLAQIHATFVEKCATRDILPTAQSLADPEIRQRAAADWSTLKLEVANLTNFDERYARVEAFYATRPWDASR